MILAKNKRVDLDDQKPKVLKVMHSRPCNAKCNCNCNCNMRMLVMHARPCRCWASNFGPPKNRKTGWIFRSSVCVDISQPPKNGLDISQQCVGPFAHEKGSPKNI